MKRTERRLKSKGIRNHKPSDAHAYFAFRYDRNYIHRKMGDVTHLPFSRGSDRTGFFEFGYEHPNIPIWSYLQSFFHRRIGASADRVLNDFYRLGWKNVKEMYYYWDSFVLPLHEHVKWRRNYYYIRDGVLAYCA